MYLEVAKANEDRMQCSQVSIEVFLTAHHGCFLELLSKKYLRQISILGTNKYKVKKNKGTFVMLILTVIFFFFRFPTYGCQKLIFVSNIFWTKIPKSSRCERWQREKGLFKLLVLFIPALKSNKLSVAGFQNILSFRTVKTDKMPILLNTTNMKC